MESLTGPPGSQNKTLDAKIDAQADSAVCLGYSGIAQECSQPWLRLKQPLLTSRNQTDPAKEKVEYDYTGLIGLYDIINLYDIPRYKIWF
jgi:hypothetical protein